jgi:hypothetical protein
VVERDHPDPLLNALSQTRHQEVIEIVGGQSDHQETAITTICVLIKAEAKRSEIVKLMLWKSRSVFLSESIDLITTTPMKTIGKTPVSPERMMQKIDIQNSKG